MNRFWLKLGRRDVERSRNSIFDHFMVRDHRSNPFTILKRDPIFDKKKTAEHIPIQASIEERQKEEVKSPKKNPSQQRPLKCYDTISGNYILTRGWDGNNMWIFKIRRRKR